MLGVGRSVRDATTCTNWSTILSSIKLPNVTTIPATMVCFAVLSMIMRDSFSRSINSSVSNSRPSKLSCVPWGKALDISWQAAIITTTTAISVVTLQKCTILTCSVVRVVVRTVFVPTLTIKLSSCITLLDTKPNTAKAISTGRDASIMNTVRLPILTRKSKLNCCTLWKKLKVFMTTSIKQFGALTPTSTFSNTQAW